MAALDCESDACCGGFGYSDESTKCTAYKHRACARLHSADARLASATASDPPRASESRFDGLALHAGRVWAGF